MPPDSASGTALLVTGRSKFSTAGTAVVASGQKKVTVTLAGVTAADFVLTTGVCSDVIGRRGGARPL